MPCECKNDMEGRISVDIREAAAAIGLSERTITNAHDRGDLVGHWSGTKRLYEPGELRTWLRSLPTQRG